jgi:hypothetical protein
MATQSLLRMAVLDRTRGGSMDASEKPGDGAAKAIMVGVVIALLTAGAAPWWWQLVDGRPPTGNGQTVETTGKPSPGITSGDPVPTNHALLASPASTTPTTSSPTPASKDRLLRTGGVTLNSLTLTVTAIVETDDSTRVELTAVNRRTGTLALWDMECSLAAPDGTTLQAIRDDEDQVQLPAGATRKLRVTFTGRLPAGVTRAEVSFAHVFTAPDFSITIRRLELRPAE